MSDSQDVIANSIIPIYTTSILGIIFSLVVLKKSNKQDEGEQDMSSEMDEKEVLIKKKSFKEKISDSEDQKEKFLPKQELNFFREMGYFFINENRYFLLLCVILAPIVLILTTYNLHWIMGMSFILGYLEFFFIFYLCRKGFIKTMIRLKLTHDSLSLKQYNWNLFIRFITSTLFILNMSLTIFSTFTILVVFDKLFINLDSKQYKNQLNNLHGDNTTTKEVYYTDQQLTSFQIIVMSYAFYLVGKNLIYILNNLWYSFHVNRNTLRYLKIYSKHSNRLVHQSYGFYYNTMSQIHKNNIIVSDVLVLSTICLAEYKTQISIFFIWLQTAILFFFLLLSIVTILSYNFKHIKEVVKMADVFDTGFSYYFILMFMFLFYQYFIKSDVILLLRGPIHLRSGFPFAYIMTMTFIAVYEIYHRFFVLSYRDKKNRRFQLQEMFSYPVNIKTLLKGFMAITILYFLFMVFGFLGVLFLFYFLSQINIFHRYKSIAVLFNIYVKTIIHFCGVSNIHHINFNKLELAQDKPYFFNYILVLFTFPLFKLNSLQHSFGRNYFRKLGINEFFIKLGLIVLGYVISTFVLLIYTKILYKSYNNYMKHNNLSMTNKQKIMNLIKERHYFFILGTVTYAIYVYLFLHFTSRLDVLCIIIGMSIHAFQLTLCNKIVVKKYWHSPYVSKFSYHDIDKMNQQLGQSPYYLQTMCEISFSNILIEVCKVLVITQFILNFIRR